MGAPKTAPSICDGATDDGRRAVSITEAALLLGIGRSTAYSSVIAGDIPSVRVGGRKLVPVRALERLLDGDRTAS
jgi:excisionase family DNA binding protein